ncbi:MAG: hypothetical protein KQH57_13225 [Actinomycetales bacterium]|nr:hypothetical protein [Actinomycetales bacterium]
MHAFTNRRTELDALRGAGTTLPVLTIDGDDWATAHTDRAHRRALAAAGETLTALRALRIAGHARIRTLPAERPPAPSVVDAVVEIQVALAGGLVLHVQPHASGGSAAVFYQATPERCWVIDLDDLSSAATTLLTMTAERVGDSAWAARHGVAAQSVRMVLAGDSTWHLGLLTDGAYVVADPDGSVLEATGRGAGTPSVVVPSSQTLARAAGDLTRDAASLLTAA